MTLPAFLAALAQTPRDWELGRYGQIRCHFGEWCPISALHQMDSGYWFDVAVELGLPEGEAEEIANAADDVTNNDELRAQLLSACGLSEARA